MIAIIGRNLPSWNCIKANAQALARYAALCLEARPRPHRRARGADGRPGCEHNIERCEKITEWAQQDGFRELY